MQEPATPDDRPFRIGLGTVVAICFVVAYFGFGLVPEWLPWVMHTGPYFFYELSFPVVLLALFILAWRGGAGLLRSQPNGTSPVSRYRFFLFIGTAGIISFAVSVGLGRVISAGLPSGSQLQYFDSAIWQSPGSAEYIEDDITPRQKMLGDVVARVLPGRGRGQLEALLGPSLDTQYFASSGRDMIYVLGPMRDSLFAMDSEWLLVWLNQSGQFERYEIAGD